MLRRAFVFLAGTLALTACVERVPPPRPFVTTPPRVAPPPIPAPAPPAPPPPSGHTIALLAPLTGPLATIGQGLVNAAQLALAPVGSPPLDVRDTGGTPQGAATAAAAALAAGDGLIIGPLTAAETAAVAPAARAAGVAVLAFTNDPSQAGPGVWPLGITPLQQVRRMVDAAMAENKTRFAAALPTTPFGQALAAALSQATQAAGAPPPDIRFYENTNPAIAATIRDLSDYVNRRGPLEAKRRAALALQTPAGRKEAAALARQPVPPPPFDALLIGETGEPLAWLSSFLAYYDLSPPAVQVMGPILWSSPQARLGATLDGAWYAAPDPSARASFEAAYTAKYNAAPPGVADLAYDAAAIGRVLAANGPYSTAALCQPQGFSGVDGLLALMPDGSVRRGLALFQINGAGATMIQPAATALPAASP
jgi:hypothetical protein